MTIGLILTFGIAALFLDSLQAQTVVNETSRVQEAGRIILKKVQDDIRKAGYRGCNTARVLSGTTQSPLIALGDGIVIPGDLTSFTLNGLDANSHSFTVSYLKPYPDARSFAATVGNDRKTVTLSTAGQVLPAITAGTQLVISNCVTQEVFSAPTSAGGGTSFSIGNELIGDYRSVSNLFELRTLTYYVDTNGRGNLSLYMNGEELVENVVAGGLTLVDQNRTTDSYLITLQVNGSSGANPVSRTFSSFATRRNGVALVY